MKTKIIIIISILLILTINVNAITVEYIPLKEINNYWELINLIEEYTVKREEIHNKLDNFGYTNGDVISGSINGKIMNDIHIKEKDSYVLELHITKDDATLYGVENGDYIDI